ncbi:hypothetical protein [Thalassospira lucentensis]|uniref:hypothetical protein n=1 Tax=Thalassospira lucentensis TaxID=168935 RepID=UPI00142D2F19|nr:hypothetical protein [Thalassospira lucentensis]NIZ03561.1 hypothetical protein [Thalassospira lucentensis]
MELIQNILGTIIAFAVGIFVVRVFWVSGRDRRSSDSREHGSLPGTHYYSGSNDGTGSDSGGRP